MTNEARLVEVLKLTGEVVVQTGLRIGGSQDTMEISGLDNPIIRNPANAEPYIPGSSLKGRMRSLAEWYFDEVPKPDGDPRDADPCSRTARVFGIPARDPGRERDAATQNAYQRGPTRLIVRDARLGEASRSAFAQGQPITEVKSENSINRLSAMANPRPMERVLPGVRFDIELVYRVFSIGDDGSEDRKLFDDVVLMALSLVQADALGGGSSRGNGKVSFENLQLNGNDITLPELTYPNSQSATTA